MQIHFTGHNIDVSPALRTFTEEKFTKITRHYDKITAINVVFNVEKLDQIAEATIFIAKNEFHARASSENLYTAIDELMDKLDRQLIKHKEKIRQS